MFVPRGCDKRPSGRAAEDGQELPASHRSSPEDNCEG
jgi:hypothetical protein